MKKIIESFVVDVFIVLLSIMAIYQEVELPKEGWGISVTYAESGEGLAGEASQLFFAEKNEAFSQENSNVQDISQEELNVCFSLPPIDMKTAVFRLDPLAEEKNFGIQNVEVLLYGSPLLTIEGEAISQYVDHLDNCVLTSGEGAAGFAATTNDPAIYFNGELNKAVKKNAAEQLRTVEIPDIFVFLVLIGAFIQLKTLLKVREKRAGEKNSLRRREALAIGIGEILLCMGAAIIYAWRYLSGNFAGIEMTEIVYHLNTSLDGTNLTTFSAAILHGVEVILAVLAVLALAVHFLKRYRKSGAKIFARCLIGLGVVLILFGTYEAFAQLDLANYIRYSMEKTNIYEDYYVDGRDVALTFPEKKRNLIYIYLESMETTYADAASGGAMEENLIPELTALAEENIDFSTKGLNGGHALSGTTFTTGGMVAQTAGMPINTSIVGTNYNMDGDHYLLPGVWALGDVLEEEGYHQVLMVGSDGSFGGRSLYFTGHGDYEIYDHDKVMSIGWLDKGYQVWWGYEDEKLIDFAKVEILNLAEQGEPFNFTMLTADTHFTAGYYCELCEDTYEYQYSNVIACSSRQIAGFVAWIKEQDFYEDTTIVISGDHLTMDSEYMEETMIDPDYARRTYFTVINAPETCKERDREFSTLDIYPTTLAAMGVTIEGDRLGMGVNLFSDTPTLYEEFGEEYLNEEFLKNSDLYQTLLY